jgi:hypothetical protein
MALYYLASKRWKESTKTAPWFTPRVRASLRALICDSSALLPQLYAYCPPFGGRALPSQTHNLNALKNRTQPQLKTPSLLH